MEQKPTQLHWRKSTRCHDPDGDCVEVAITDSTVSLRNSTERGRELSITVEAWHQFLQALRSGEFDRP